MMGDSSGMRAETRTRKVAMVKRQKTRDGMSHLEKKHQGKEYAACVLFRSLVCCPTVFDVISTVSVRVHAFLSCLSSNK